MIIITRGTGARRKRHSETAAAVVSVAKLIIEGAHIVSILPQSRTEVPPSGNITDIMCPRIAKDVLKITLSERCRFGSAFAKSHQQMQPFESLLPPMSDLAWRFLVVG